MQPDIPIGKPFPDDPVSTSGTYTGPFRAKVKKNNDNEEDDKFLGRIRVWIPQVHGEDYEDRIEDLPWAWPCFLHASKGEDGGLKAGFVGIPPEESWVYVIFENGDPDHPIYLGGWYAGKEGDSDIDDYLKEDSRSSARYPNIIGYISPLDGKFRFRILDADRFEMVWNEDGEDKATFEFDSIGAAPNDEPTVRLDTKWKVWVKATKDIKLESGETVEIKCKKFKVEATEKVEVNSQGSSKYEAAGTNTFKGATIKGSGEPDGGFDLYGVTRRRGSS